MVVVVIVDGIGIDGSVDVSCYVVVVVFADDVVVDCIVVGEVVIVDVCSVVAYVVAVVFVADDVICGDYVVGVACGVDVAIGVIPLPIYLYIMYVCCLHSCLL